MVGLKGGEGGRGWDSCKGIRREVWGTGRRCEFRKETGGAVKGAVGREGGVQGKESEDREGGPRAGKIWGGKAGRAWQSD